MRKRDHAQMLRGLRRDVERSMSARLAYASEADPENERPLLESCERGALVDATVEARRVMHRAVVRAEVLEGKLVEAMAALRDAREREGILRKSAGTPPATVAATD